MKKWLVFLLILTVPCVASRRRVVEKGGGAVAAGGGGQTVTDDFNRADGADLGASWTPVTSTFTISGNAAVPSSTFSDACERYSGVAWTDNQSSEAEITTTGVDSGSGAGVAVRCSASAETFYRLVINTQGEWELLEVIAGSFNALASGTVTYSAGAVLKLSAVGTTLTSTYNGSQIDTRTDTSIASGSPGVAYSSISATPSIDDWRGIDGL